MGVDAERNDPEHDDEESEREPMIYGAGRQYLTRRLVEHGSDRS
jgi:hypothetical protein